MIGRGLFVFRSILIVVAFIPTIIIGHAQSSKYLQIVDSISVAYKKMQKYHMQVQTKVSISGQQVASQTYDIYKQGENLYLSSAGMEMLYNSSIVLMILKDQKQMIIRPVTETELQTIKKFEAPVIDSINKALVFKNFSETEIAYQFTVYADKGQIIKTVYSYDKKSYLLVRVDVSYADTDENKNQRSVILYTYSPLLTSSNYFNSEKYLIKTKSGFAASAAYPNYFINIADTYEK